MDFKAYREMKAIEQTLERAAEALDKASLFAGRHQDTELRREAMGASDSLKQLLLYMK